jgi:hypothetical protein
MKGFVNSPEHVTNDQLCKSYSPSRASRTSMVSQPTDGFSLGH